MLTNRDFLKSLAAVWFILAAACSQNASPASRANEATRERLHRFMETFNRDSLADEAILAQLNTLNEQLVDADLSTVEEFALTDEGKAAAWLFAKVLVDRTHYDSAARLFVTSLEEPQENRQYRMWKFWE